MKAKISKTMRISLNKGKFALIDKEDFHKISGFNWRLTSHGYARAEAKVAPCKYVELRMHRLIIDVPADKHIDHINHNTLDNRKKNLRVVNASQNAQNRKWLHKGVHYCKASKKYRAQVYINGKRVYLGLHTDREGAETLVDFVRHTTWTHRNTAL